MAFESKMSLSFHLNAHHAVPCEIFRTRALDLLLKLSHPKKIKMQGKIQYSHKYSKVSISVTGPIKRPMSPETY